MNAIQKLSLCGLLGLSLIGTSGCGKKEVEKIPPAKFCQIQLLNGTIIQGIKDISSDSTETDVYSDSKFLRYDPVEKSRVYGKVLEIIVYDQEPRPPKLADNLYSALNSKLKPGIEVVYNPDVKEGDRWALFRVDTNDDQKTDWFFWVRKDVDKQLRYVKEGDKISFPTLRKLDPSKDYPTPDKYVVLKWGAEYVPGEIQVIK